MTDDGMKTNGAERPNTDAAEAAADSVNTAESGSKTKTNKHGAWKAVLIVVAVLAFLIAGTLAVRGMPGIGHGKKEPGVTYTEEEATQDFDESVNFAESTGMEAPMGAVRMDGAAMKTAAVNGDMGAGEAISEKKIIRTVDVTIGTKTFDDTFDAIRAACTSAGGWVEYASKDEQRNGQRNGNLTLRVPEDKLDAFDTTLAASGRLIRMSESANDVTESYQDNEARLETQKALMARLKALMSDTAELGDLLALESQIADTQYRIDSLQRSLDHTDRQVSYSTVNVWLIEETTAADTDDKELSFGERVGAAIEVGLRAFGGFMQDMAVFIVYALPFLLGAGVIVLIVVLIVKKSRKK